jgi:hypothetical protein
MLTTVTVGPSQGRKYGLTIRANLASVSIPATELRLATGY